MSNIYSEPEKFGLQTVGEVEFSSGCYEFDTSVLWRDVLTGALFIGDDSGCSCPCPFEYVGRGDLTMITRPQDLIDYFDERKAGSYRYGDEDGYDRARIDGEIGALIIKAGEPA